MFERLRNLWRISEFKPERSDEILNQEDLVLRRTIHPIPKQRLATIVELEEPIDLFPDHDDSIEQPDTN